MKSKIRPATPEDIEFFFGTIAKTVRAWVVEYNGEPKGIAGTYREGNVTIAFSEILEHTAPKITVYRLAKELMNKMTPPVYAVPEDCLKGSRKFLESLGFERVKGNIYIWQHSPRFQPFSQLQTPRFPS